MGFRDAILQLCPPWLARGNAGALMRALGATADGLNADLKTGVKYRFPDYAPPEALPLLGNDRNIEQGPNEPDDRFRARLRGEVDENKRRGNGPALLEQLAAYFGGQPGLVEESGDFLTTEAGETITTET